jgi:hypothetical protein
MTWSSEPTFKKQTRAPSPNSLARRSPPTAIGSYFSRSASHKHAQDDISRHTGRQMFQGVTTYQVS